MSEKRAMVIRLERNSLLSRLLACSPGSLKGEVLFRVLIGIHPDLTRAHFHRDLNYLEGKHLVDRLSPVSGKPSCEYGFDESFWRLSPEGDEVANRLVRDPALEL